MFSGVFDVSWLALAVIALVLTHITIAGVTLYLHRSQAHRSLEFHPIVSHFFRFWLWLTTGMVTKEWTAVHRKHHARCETEEDPHSPQIKGLWKILFGGVYYYRQEAMNPETIKRYGYATPDDWLERNLYTRYNAWGVFVLLTIDVVLFGVVPGAVLWGVQVVWIPFWAAGVINGVAHYTGYRLHTTPDASRNISPVGILIGGEEFHNNHHAFPTSAKLSYAWYEFDIGWLYVRLLQALSLVEVKSVTRVPRFDRTKSSIDLTTFQAIFDCRYDVMQRYTKVFREVFSREQLVASGQHCLKPLLRALSDRGDIELKSLPEEVRVFWSKALDKSHKVRLLDSMRCELLSLWQRSNESGEQLVKKLEDWCRRAEESDVPPLVDFSKQLKTYA